MLDPSMMAQVSRRRLPRSGEPLEWGLDAVFGEAEPPGHHQEVDRVENPLHQESQDRGRDRPLEDEGVLPELDAGEDGLPSPPAPISAARVAVPTLMTALVLIPAMIAGEAMGRRTRRSFAAPERPIASAASASGWGMVVRPT